MQSIALLFTGYSVFYSIALFLSHFRCENYQGQRFSQIMGMILITALATLQLAHFFYLNRGDPFVFSPVYTAVLYLVAPSFYLFSRPLLKADNSFQRWQILHFVPLFFAFILPNQQAFLLAFGIGGFYLLWLAKSIFALRKQRTRFHIELTILLIVFIIAILVLIMGLSQILVDERTFFILYASAIGLAFFLINIALAYAPRITHEVSDAARETYQKSTLGGIDCDSVLQQLDSLMQDARLYQENNLDLHSLASELDLTSHQLSELINTRLGKSFSRYIREQRVQAAKTQLLDEPNASVLSIAMSVGFTSQSNFYDAFREIVGTTPAKFRKLNKMSL